MHLVQRLKELPIRTRKILAGALLCLVALLIYPFQTTVVPMWNLRVVDEQGATVPGINVTQHWQHNSLEPDGHEELQKTNGEGQVVFPDRTIRASLVSRTVAPALKLLREGTGAKLGAYASVVAWGSKANETNVSIYTDGAAPPAQIVVVRVK